MVPPLMSQSFAIPEKSAQLSGSQVPHMRTDRPGQAFPASLARSGSSHQRPGEHSSLKPLHTSRSFQKARDSPSNHSSKSYFLLPASQSNLPPTCSCRWPGKKTTWVSESPSLGDRRKPAVVGKSRERRGRRQERVAVGYILPMPAPTPPWVLLGSGA